MKPIQKIEYEKGVLKSDLLEQVYGIIQALADKYSDETGGCVESIRILFRDVTEFGDATKKSVITNVEVF